MKNGSHECGCRFLVFWGIYVGLHHVSYTEINKALAWEHVKQLGSFVSYEPNSYFQAPPFIMNKREFLWFESLSVIFYSSNHVNQYRSPLFSQRFLLLVVEELKNDVDNKEDENVTIQFFGEAIVGVTEWWFKQNKWGNLALKYLVIQKTEAPCTIRGPVSSFIFAEYLRLPLIIDIRFLLSQSNNCRLFALFLLPPINFVTFEQHLLFKQLSIPRQL